MIAKVIGRGRNFSLFLMLQIGRGLRGTFRLIFPMLRRPSPHLENHTNSWIFALLRVLARVLKT